jgi:hypothetical protein
MAERSTTGAVGSLLMIRIVAISVPTVVDVWYTTVNSISSPGATTKGVLGVESTEKLVELTYMYVDFGKYCTAQPSKGFEFNNWVENPLTNRNSSG